MNVVGSKERSRNPRTVGENRVLELSEGLWLFVSLSSWKQRTVLQDILGTVLHSALDSCSPEHSAEENNSVHDTFSEQSQERATRCNRP